MRAASGLLALCLVASGQVPLSPEKLPAGIRDFDSARGEGELSCSVERINPRINLAFQFWAGYIVQVPLRQFTGPRQGVTILARVRPEATGDPSYFASRVRLPSVPEGTKARAEIAGGFLVGEGRYRVDLLVVDSRGRLCRKGWRMQARAKGAERQTELGIQPNTVRALAPPQWSGAVREGGARVTILLHAAPLGRRRVALTPYDKLSLLGTLTSLLERMPAASLRLVLFNLDQQAEYFEADPFGPAEFQELAQRLSEVQLGTVDAAVLANRRGHLDLLSRLIRAQLEDEPSPDAVVFVGPAIRRWDKLPRTELPDAKRSPARFYYFQLRQTFRRGPNYNDTISAAVRALGGRTVSIFSAGEFAAGLKQVEKDLSAQ
jgi:hypothetical protein